jgi:hypothetical protein
MSLQLDAGEGNVLNLFNPRLDENAQSFVLMPADGSEDVYVSYTSPSQKNVPHEDYLIYAFARYDYSESDIYELYLKQDERRIGMVFPLQAAVSREHDKAGDVRFLRFAQGAFRAICEGLEMAYLKKPSANQRSFSIFDFYAPNTIVVAIYKPSLPDAANFRVEDYFASFIKYGYFSQQRAMDPNKIAPETKNQFETIVARVYIEVMAPEMQQIAFVTHLLQTILPYENTPLLRFFYLYQIVELMMGTLLEISFADFKNRLSKAPAAASGIREVMEDLQDQLSEKKRISRLFDYHIKPTIELVGLRNSCNAFLKSLGNTSATPEHLRGVAEFLYPVRNMLFHNLRNVDPANLVKLEEIAVAMRIAVCDMLIRFSKK